LEERDDVLTISAGSERLEELRKSIVGITQNKGDFAMTADGKRRPPDHRLWSGGSDQVVRFFLRYATRSAGAMRTA